MSKAVNDNVCDNVKGNFLMYIRNRSMDKKGVAV